MCNDQICVIGTCTSFGASFLGVESIRKYYFDIPTSAIPALLGCEDSGALPPFLRSATAQVWRFPNSSRCLAPLCRPCFGT